MKKSQTQDECPKCHGMLETDGTCSCGYGVTRRRASADQASRNALTGQLCAWNDHGRGCVCKGIISNTTNGEGSWFCREHWERINGREQDVIGNALPTARLAARRAQTGAQAPRPFRKPAEWLEGETYADFRRRVAERVGREPGDDDDFVVPELAGQS